jgi:hypothetical protein
LLGNASAHGALAVAAMNNDIEFAILGQFYQIAGYFFHGATKSRGLFSCSVLWL